MRPTVFLSCVLGTRLRALAHTMATVPRPPRYEVGGWAVARVSAGASVALLEQEGSLDRALSTDART